MKLKEYLKENKFTQQSFLDHIEMAKGVKIPPSTFAKWVRRIRIPRKQEAQIIYDVTLGEVQPKDFYDIKK